MEGWVVAKSRDFEATWNVATWIIRGERVVAPGAEFCLEHGNETATGGKTIFRRGAGRGRTTRDRSLKPLFKFPMDITLRHGNATRKFNHCIYIYVYIYPAATEPANSVTSCRSSLYPYRRSPLPSPFFRLDSRGGLTRGGGLYPLVSWYWLPSIHPFGMKNGMQGFLGEKSNRSLFEFRSEGGEGSI